MFELLKLLLRLFIRIIFSIRIVGKENIPKEGGYIAACNHQSYWDPVFMASVLKGKFAFMAKKELFRNRAFAWLITKFGAFPIERGKRDSGAIETAIERIKMGKVFIIYPEGTRSKDGKLGRGKSGVALIAGMAEAPILPMCISYRGKLRFRTRVTISIGEMIPHEELAVNPENSLELRNASRRIMEEIRLLKEAAEA
ncbi:MAG: 1-acyl-sn-glycerol-3-phosphate acyltransferase [Clostridiales bacterium]|nr:1-acyl-sn-glycerol-3-phosphate acyltransferase [Clostridiales bacterium]